MSSSGRGRLVVALAYAGSSGDASLASLRCRLCRLGSTDWWIDRRVVRATQKQGIDQQDSNPSDRRGLLNEPNGTNNANAKKGSSRGALGAPALPACTHPPSFFIQILPRMPLAPLINALSKSYNQHACLLVPSNPPTNPTQPGQAQTRTPKGQNRRRTGPPLLVVARTTLSLDELACGSMDTSCGGR